MFMNTYLEYYWNGYYIWNKILNMLEIGSTKDNYLLYIQRAPYYSYNYCYSDFQIAICRPSRKAPIALCLLLSTSLHRFHKRVLHICIRQGSMLIRACFVHTDLKRLRISWHLERKAA